MQKNIQNIYEQVKKVADYAEKINAENERLESSKYTQIYIMDRKNELQAEYANIASEAGSAIKNEKDLLIHAIVKSFAVSGKNINEDSALFGIPGLQLSPADVHDILKRNPNNALIFRLAQQWCSDNDSILVKKQMEDLNLVTEDQKGVAAIRLIGDCYAAVMHSEYNSTYQKFGWQAIHFRDKWDAICGYNIKLIGNV